MPIPYLVMFAWLAAYSSSMIIRLVFVLVPLCCDSLDVVVLGQTFPLESIDIGH